VTKDFKNLKPEHLKGLGYWFWLQEAYATATDNMLSYFGNWDEYNVWQKLFICSAPIFVYIVTPFYGVYIRYREVTKNAKEGLTVSMCSKKSIKYFTVLNSLSGPMQ
jgi:hypothetical protein